MMKTQPMQPMQLMQPMQSIRLTQPAQSIEAVRDSRKSQGRLDRLDLPGRQDAQTQTAPPVRTLQAIQALQELPGAFPMGEEPFSITGGGICAGACSLQPSGALLGYMARGGGTVRTLRAEGGELSLSQGEVFWIPAARCPCAFTPASPSRLCFFTLEGELVENMLRIYGCTKEASLCSPEAEACFQAFCGAACEEKEGALSLERCSLFFHRLLLLARRDAARSLPIPQDIQELKAYLDENPGKPVSVGEISRLVSRSPDCAIRIFKKYYGETPYAYQLRRKTESACRLLLHTDLTVREIADQLGFCDQHYFSNLFKRLKGLSPSAYRLLHTAPPMCGPEPRSTDGPQREDTEAKRENP